MDIYYPQTTEYSKVLYTLSSLFSLIKVLYLIRVFRQFSFLAMMIIQVVYDVKYFFVLFGIFLMCFAMCYRILGIELSNYGRTPKMMSMFLATLRSAMGDFSIINPYTAFDVWDM